MISPATLDRIHAELEQLTRHQKHARKPIPGPVYLDHQCDEPFHYANDGKHYGAHTRCTSKAVTVVDGRHYCWTHNKMRLRDAKGAA